jgi:hypothetical protein
MADHGLERLLDSVPVHELTNDVRLEYLLDFLETCTGHEHFSPGVAQRLLRLTATLLERIPADEWSRHASLLRRLIVLTPQPQRRAFKPEGLEDLDAAVWRAVLQGLLALDLDVLLVPDGLEPADKPSTGMLSLYDAERLLQLLADPPHGWREAQWYQDQGAWRNAETIIAVNILQGTGEDYEEAVIRFRHLPLFYGYDYTTNKHIALAIDDLDNLLRARTLFVYGPRHPNAGMARPLQQALRDRKVVLTRTSIARCLFTANAITPCDSEGCLRTLAAKPSLAPATERASLLGQLLDRASASVDRRASRYLLHGVASQYNQDGVDLLVTSYEPSTVWATLTRLALAQSEEGWRVLSPALAETLSPAHRSILGIKVIDSATTASVLAACDPARIDCTLLTEEERQTVLRELDIAILCRMHVHEDRLGILRTADHGCYLEGDFPLDDPLFADLTILRRNKDLRIAKRQEQFAMPLNAPEVLRVALAQADPAAHWPVIMAALEAGRVQTLPEALRSTAWVPTRLGRAVPPEEVIYLPGLDDDVGRIVPDCGGIYVDVLALDDAVRAHPAFERVLLAHVLPAPADALGLLGEIMGDSERYRLGAIALDGVDLATFLNAFTDAPAELLPARAMLHAVCRQPYANLCGTHLLPKLLQDPAPERLIKILNFLCRKQETAPYAGKKLLLDIFRRYLARVSAAPEVRAILRDVSLLSQQGTWMPSASLCFDDTVDNLEDDHLLDREMALILRESGYHVTNAGKATALDDITTTDISHHADPAMPLTAGERLRVYFAPWLHHVPEQVIGGFLCLLGDDPSVRLVAEVFRTRAKVGG